MEDSIAHESIQIERKQFSFDLRENRRGILLRVTEEVRGHRDTIIIPATGLRDFSDALLRMIEVIEEEDLDPTDPTADEGDEDGEGFFDDEDEGPEDEDTY
jgi:hypothetical protein